jgi:hypothetical protein
MEDTNFATGQPGPIMSHPPRHQADLERPPGSACVIGCAVCAAFGVLFAYLFWVLVLTPMFTIHS